MICPVELMEGKHRSAECQRGISFDWWHSYWGSAPGEYLVRLTASRPSGILFPEPGPARFANPKIVIVR